MGTIYFYYYYCFICDTLKLLELQNVLEDFNFSVSICTDFICIPNRLELKKAPLCHNIFDVIAIRETL